MGSAVGVEAAKYEDLDYETLKKSGIDFGKAHNALDRKLKRSTTSLAGMDEVGSIHYFAMRQLSHNLKNQDRLNQKKDMVLQSRSVPNNLLLVEDEEDDDGGAHSVHRNRYRNRNDETLRPDDLELMHDEEYNHMPETATTTLIDTTNQMTQELELSLKPKPKGKKPKPMLSLQLTSEAFGSSLGASLTTGATSDTATASVSTAAASKSESSAGGRESPSSSMWVSPRGTVYMGKYKVQENGIFLAETSRVKGFSSDAKGVPTHTLSGVSDLASTMNASIARKPPPALVGGKQDFIEIAALGSGASGVVTEALHVPTLTLVALKMLPVYNKEKRQSVSRELGVLYKNLAELELVDDLGGEVIDLEDEDAADVDETITTAAAAAIQRQISSKLIKTGTAKTAKSPHILSLYNAFVDPRSGMINLVIEYMDGGSLEDLVKQGGCQDEQVLADICFQTCKGLAFLHKHHNIHRDIKPANILCSSSGQIKIADFGIAKALDKTSSFAHSFVGTVCYMSPERITGDNYTYSGDIWSLGLTMLAVANGRFPLSGKESNEESNAVTGGSDWDEDGNDRDARRNKKLNQGAADPPSNGIIGGAAGYWAMIKAICDDDPPEAGPHYSAGFNEFISACLKKDPKQRLTAVELLEIRFIRDHAFASQQQLLPSEMNAWEETRRRPSAVADSSREESSRSSRLSLPGFSRRKSSGDSKRHTPRSDSNDFSGNGSGPPTPSALTARLTNAAIERRTSRDLMLRGSGSTDAQQSQPLPLDANDFRPRSTTEEYVHNGDTSGGPDPILMSIRLEHLDRLLDKIEKRLDVCAGRLNGDEVSEADELDVLGMHDFSGGDLSGGSKNTLQQHSSLDSMDDLLQYKEEAPPPLSQQAVDTPTTTSPAYQLHRDEAKSSVSSAAMAAAVRVPLNRNPTFSTSQTRGLLLADAKSASDDDRSDVQQVAAVRSKQPMRASASLREQDNAHEDPHNCLISAQQSSTLTHSILKGTASYVASHNSAVAGGEESLRPEEKKARWAAGRGRFSETGFNSSNRSVHFSEGGEIQNRSAVAVKPKKSLRSRLNLHALEIDEHYGELEEEEQEGNDDEQDDDPYSIDNNDFASSAIPHPKLPKTSSYFIHTKTDSKDENSPAHAAAAARKSARIRAQQPPPDITRTLPRLNRRGVAKWENLASQLHLPLHLVKTAVKTKLSHLIDLQEEPL